MAASKPNRRTGCNVTSAASSGVRINWRKECFWLQGALFGQTPPRLAHQPDGRAVHRQKVHGVAHPLAAGGKMLQAARANRGVNVRRDGAGGGVRMGSGDGVASQ